MIKAGVIGHPISHSKSPLIHGFWLRTHGIDGEYKTYDIDPDHFGDGMKQMIDAGIKGFNVTIPHKQRIIPFCDSLSDEAREIGAVNTVTVTADKKLHGHNTDAFGFTQNLEESCPDFNWTEFPATVIGAGGAARAVMTALQNKGVPEIRITNRTRESAENLAGQAAARVYDWDERSQAVHESGLIINTTSLGMKGQASLDINLSGAADNAIIYDIVYTPLITPLLQQAQEKGCRTVTGIGMLLHQARPGFEAWFGIYPTVTKELEDLIINT